MLSFSRDTPIKLTDKSAAQIHVANAITTTTLALQVANNFYVISESIEKTELLL